MLRTMFYVKNVPMVERVLRVVLGSGLAVGAMVVFFQPTSGQLFKVLALAALLSAFFVAATGFVGWCPACAMVGRKLKSGQHAQ